MFGQGRRFEILRAGYDWKLSVVSSSSATWGERTQEGLDLVNFYIKRWGMLWEEKTAVCDPKVSF